MDLFEPGGFYLQHGSVDTWLDEVESAHDWRLINPLGDRIRFCRNNETTQFAYLKAEAHLGEALHEKVAADLALMLRLPAAPCLLLWAAASMWSVSRAPAHHHDRLEVARRALARDRSHTDVDSIFRRLYPSDLYPFDLWVGNDDRNEANLVLVTSATDQSMIVAIDHGACFGGNSGWRGAEHPPRCSSKPSWASIDKAQAVKFCDRIESIEDAHIRYIVARAASVYKDPLPDHWADEIARHLVVRKAMVRQWTKESLES